MFDLTNIGAANRAGDAGANAPLHAEESADTASFRSFVEALRSLAAVDGAEVVPGSTWLAASPADPTAGTPDLAGAEAPLLEPSLDQPDESAAIAAVAPMPVDVPVLQARARALAPAMDPTGAAIDIAEREPGGEGESVADVVARPDAAPIAPASSRAMPTPARQTRDVSQLPAADTFGVTGDAVVAENSTAAGAPAPLDPATAAESTFAEASPANAREADDAARPTTSREPARLDVIAAAVSAGSDSDRDDHPRRSAQADSEAHAPAAVPRRPPQVSGTPVVPTVATVISSAYAHAWRVALAQADAAAAPTPEALPSDTTAQIVQAMRLQWTKGVGEAHIRLDPAQYGDLTVSLRVDDGQVVARVQSDTAAVRDWLQSHQGWLRQSLSDQGLTLSRLEVHEPSSESRDEREPGGRESGSRDADQPPARRPRRSSSDGVFEVVA